MALTRIAHAGTTAAEGFRSAVSLHSHTHHSREVLEFLPGWAAKIPLIGRFVRRAQQRHEREYGRPLDFSRAYWCPPLSPRAVFESETEQISRRLQAAPLVSITDHDTIDACLALRLLGPGLTVPVSVEWTIPYRGTIFHVGVHNIPPDAAAMAIDAFRTFTREPSEPRLGDILAWLHRSPSTLVVLNHPLWNGSRDQDQDALVLTAFVRAYRPFLHATEINGYRDHAENRAVIRLGAEWDLPVLAGGDRHGRAPNAMINLTDAATMDEFVDEVRRAGQSTAIVMPEYREHPATRVLEAVSDVLRHHADLDPGQQRWSDRVFVIQDDGRHLPLTALWESGAPFWVRACVGMAGVLGSGRARRALRLGLAMENGGVL